MQSFQKKNNHHEWWYQGQFSACNQALNYIKCSFNQLAALLYRDNIRQKHQARDRLLKELTDKKAEEDRLRHKDALKKLDFGGQNKDPVAELLVEHLLIAPWWSPSSGR